MRMMAMLIAIWSLQEPGKETRVTDDELKNRDNSSIIWRFPEILRIFIVSQTLKKVFISLHREINKHVLFNKKIWIQMIRQNNSVKKHLLDVKLKYNPIAQSAGAVEYTDCTSASEKTSSTSVLDLILNNLTVIDALRNAEYPFIGLAPRSTLTQGGSTW